MRPIPDAPHLSPQFKTGQPIDIRQTDLGLSHPVLAQGFRNRRKAQAPQQAFRQLWVVGQQRADPPTAALPQQAGADAAEAMALQLHIDQGQHRTSRMVQPVAEESVRGQQRRFKPRSYDQQAHLVEQISAHRAIAQLHDRRHLHLSQA